MIHPAHAYLLAWSTSMPRKGAFTRQAPIELLPPPEVCVLASEGRVYGAGSLVN